MKKFFYMSVLVLMAALTLTSCGSDDDKQKDEPTPTSKTINYEASVTFTQDMIDICDVTMVYKDADGKTVTETVTSKTWNKKFTVKKVPALVGVKCNLKMKDGVQLTKEKYDIIAELYHDVTVNGVSKGFSTPFYFVRSQGVHPDKVAEIVSRASGREAFAYSITADAKVNSTQDITF